MIFFGATVPISGCKKTVIHDTTVTTVHDTTIKAVHDTTIKKDSSYILTDGLVAYYNFNGGTLKDSSGYNNHITSNIDLAATADRFGNAGNAYLFNGHTSFMKVPNSASLNPGSITIFAIVKVNGFSALGCSDMDVLVKGSPDPVNGLCLLRVADSAPCDGVSDSTHNFFGGAHGDNVPEGSTSYANSDTAYIQKGTWYKVAYTYDGLVAKFYVNGVLKTTRVKSTVFTPNAQDLFIGRNESSIFPYWFNGAIDEIRIYNRALDQSAITRLYNFTSTAH